MRDQNPARTNSYTNAFTIYGCLVNINSVFHKICIEATLNIIINIKVNTAEYARVQSVKVNTHDAS